MHMLLFALLCLVSLVSGRFQHQTVSQNIASLRNFFNEKRNINKKTNVESGTIDISFANNNQDYSIIVNKKEWLVSGLTSFRSNNNWVNLTLNSTESHKGNDNFGEYNDITLFWHDIDNTDSVMATGFRTYPNKPDIIILSQTFPNGLCDMVTNNGGDMNGIVSSFPSFKIRESNDSKIDLAYAHFGGFFASAQYARFGLWRNGANYIELLNGGLQDSGPLCIYNINSNNGIVIAPLTYHMSASDNITSVINNNDNDNINDKNKNKNSVADYDYDYDYDYEFRYGIVGNVSSIPKEFKISWIISLKSNGLVNSAMYNWGNYELEYYNKPRDNSHLRDYTLNYLGYSTDNGAYYYYTTEPNKNYQETIIDIKNYLEKESIPVKYVLLDSWWYYQGVNGGVKEWSAKPDIFPNGMSYLYNETKWPVVAHNRYWSIDNIYANNNPPPYNNNHSNKESLFPFTYSGYDALPQSREFWDYLFTINNNWGLIVYEQDWLSTSEITIPLVYSNVTFGRDWLLDMGLSADNFDLSIEYCMAYPRHVLTSVELLSVTQARASNDYQPGNTLTWKIGVSSLLISSLGLMPSKDSYWSMNSTQNGGHYANGTYEPYSRLQSLVLSLSNGPITFGDKIGYSNRSLIMRACNDDGLLLRPDTSATIIDRYFIYQAYYKTNLTFAQMYGINGQVWSTYSKIGDYNRYLYLFVAELDTVDRTNASIVYQDLLYNFDKNNNNNDEGDDEDSEDEAEEMVDSYLVFETNATSNYFVFRMNESLSIKSCQMHDFQYYTFIPLIHGLGNDVWYLQGEINKWIAVSAQRFQNIETSDTGSIAVTVYGAINETVYIAFVNGKSLQQVIIACTIEQTQTMIVKMPAQTCQSY